MEIDDVIVIGLLILVIIALVFMVIAAQISWMNYLYDTKENNQMNEFEYKDLTIQYVFWDGDDYYADLKDATVDQVQITGIYCGDVKLIDLWETDQDNIFSQAFYDFIENQALEDYKDRHNDG